MQKNKINWECQQDKFNYFTWKTRDRLLQIIFTLDYCLYLPGTYVVCYDTYPVSAIE